MFTKLCAGVSKLCLMLAVIGLIAVVLCVQWQVIGRYVFNDTPTWAEALAMLLVLFVTAFGLAVGVRDAGHIGLESLVGLLPLRWQRRIEYVIHALVALFGVLMVQSGWLWMSAKWGEKKPMLPVPDGIDYLPIVIAGALIVLFSIEHIVALMRGTGGASMELTVLGLSFTLFLILGVPVAFAIGLSSVATIIVAGLPVAVVFQKMVGGMQVFSFLAIPFFVFAGELMLYGGIADRIVRFANSLVGHVRGGLGMSNVVGCTLFGGVAGSPLADVSAIGSVMIPLMKKEGYDADYAVNVTTHASLVGAIMPTSHNMIIFTLATSGIASVSVLSLILAGLIPALILTLCNLGAAYYVAVKRGYPTHGKFPGWTEVLRAFGAALPGLLVIVIILAGILSGAFTATESASIAVAWALAITVLVYRSLSWHSFLKACAKACKTTGVVLLLIGISAAFGYFMALYEVPQLTGELMKSVSDKPWVIFLMINVLLFVLGTFLDMAATILICTPIFLPIAMQFGMDPTQFGIVMLINCALGLNTPPVGSVQFVGCAIGGISVGQVMRTIAPFYGALGICLLLVTYVPAFSLWLPGLVK